MHNVDVDALEETTEKASQDPDAVRQTVELEGEWQPSEGSVQFRGEIPYPNGSMVFEADFPPPMGGHGAAPNPLAYCFWGGLACYAMTFAQEAAREGVEVHRLHAKLGAEVDQSRALGVSERPPVERIAWELEVDADADADRLEELKRRADEHCPGVWCVRNPVELETSLSTASG